MPVAACTVTGTGGWIAFGASFPADLNDGNDSTYEYTPGDSSTAENLTYDYTQVPTGATISAISASGGWGAGSPSATVAVVCHLGGNTTSLGTLGDVTSYNTGSIARPGGGSWTKTDLQTMFISFTSQATGNGNAIKHRSSLLSVTYTGSVTAGFITSML